MPDLAINVYDEVKVSRSLCLNGSGYASIADASQTGLDMGTSDFMIEAWVKPGAGGAWQRMVDKWSPSGWTFTFTSADKLEVSINDGIASRFATSSLSYTECRWYYFVAIVDKSSATGLKIYVDGSEVAYSRQQDVSGRGNIDNAIRVTVGADKNGGVNFTGQLNEVRVWNFGVDGLPADFADYIAWRYAHPYAPTSEYDSGSWNTYVTNNLKGYWKFNGDYLDETSNDNDLTAGGSGNLFDESEYGSFGRNLVSLPSVYDTPSITESLSFSGKLGNIDVNDVSSLTESIGRNLKCLIKSSTTPGIQLWSKLGSAAEITSPEIGTAGSVVGSPDYEAAKFNNGILSDVDNEGCTFPTAGNNINLDKGTIEFWAKLNFAPTDAAYHYLFDFCDYSNGGIRLYFNVNTDDFDVVAMSGGGTATAIGTSGLSWSSGDILHFVITWDRTGVDIGSSKTLVLYVDNVEKASSTTTWSADTVDANLYIGMRSSDGLHHSDAVIDNVKTFNICKIDFSDKDTEGADSGPIEAVSVAESILTTGLSYINVNDPVGVTDVDAVSLLTLFNLVVNDNVGVAEDVGVDPLLLKAIVSDSSVITELVSNAAILAGIDVNDSISLAEYTKAARIYLISKYEEVGVAEALTVKNPIAGISVVDAVSVLEKVYLEWWLAIVKDDTTWSDISKGDTPWSNISKDDTAWSDVR